VRIGLVLSGGGLRGASHVGVLHALVEHGIPIDVIAGASAGAVIAALGDAPPPTESGSSKHPRTGFFGRLTRKLR